MNVHEEFQKILSKLQAGERVRINRSEEDWTNMMDAWDAELSVRTDEQALLKVLCILEHTIPPYHPDCYPFLLNFMGDTQQRHHCMGIQGGDPHTVVALLGVSHKIVLSEFSRRGERVPREFFLCLESLFERKDKDITEWIFRTLLESGTEASYLFDKVNSIKLGWLDSLHGQGKTIKLLREELVKKWENLPRVPK